MGLRPRDPIHPQVDRLYRRLAAGRAAAAELTPAALRQALDSLQGLFPEDPPGCEAPREIRLPGPAGEVRALVFGPPTAGGRPLVVHLHGGGWVGWSPESHASFCRRLALEAGVIVASIDYRLAPEHPYPAALEDSVSAFRHLRRHAGDLGGDPGRVAAAGDSAGGNLGAALTLRLLANGEAPPDALLLLCPVLDAGLDTGSFRTFAPDDPLLHATVMHFFRDCYVRPEQWHDPFVSPLRADLAGFPSTCLVVGDNDPFYDDARRFAEKLRAAGGEVQLDVYPGMPHEFTMFDGLDAGARAFERMGAFLRGALAGQGSEAFSPPGRDVAR